MAMAIYGETIIILRTLTLLFSVSNSYSWHSHYPDGVSAGVGVIDASFILREVEEKYGYI